MMRSGKPRDRLCRNAGAGGRADIPVGEVASSASAERREFSTKQWEIEGCFAAAENLPRNPALHLTEAIDSPLYQVGAGLELNGVNGVGLAIRYNGAFVETVKQNAVSASLKVSFQLTRDGGQEGMS
ncbi:hypothetical protein MPLSOD_140598 [Mesorhizobium sp. SOD10]|nr:hypothetical protein MPLSOD_140598 [Mesorhizobium sp. SOD10]